MKHVIILHTDQQRYDSLGCNGNEEAITPNIDALAEEGCNFSRHIAANPVCMPSRSSLLTGLYVPGHQVLSNGVPLWRRDRVGDQIGNEVASRFGVNLMEKVPTLADILGDNGYHTAMFGKLHLEPHMSDKKHGYYESYDYWDTEEAERYDKPLYGFLDYKLIAGHGEDVVKYSRGHYGRWIHKEHPEILDITLESPDKKIGKGTRPDIFTSKIPKELHMTTWLGNQVSDYIDTYECEKPLFMFVGFPDPHRPYTPPEELVNQFSEIPLPEFAKREDIKGQKATTEMWAMDRNTSGKEDCAKAYRNTMASVHLIDTSIGQIVDSLKEKGLYEDTVIVFTSDHGDYLGDFDMLAKNEQPYHNLLHVPFVVKGAKSDKLPANCKTPMSNADVVPTILSMVDVDVDDYIQGIDIFSGDAKDNTPMVSCFSLIGDERSISLYDETYRYSYYLESDEEALYNHIDDEKELNNLVNDPDVDVVDICKVFKEKVMNKHIQSENALFNHYSLW